MKRLGPLHIIRCRLTRHEWAIIGTDPTDDTRLTRHCRSCGTYQDWDGRRWTNNRGHDYQRPGTLTRPPLPAEAP